MGKKSRKDRLLLRAAVERRALATQRKLTDEVLARYPGPGAVNGYQCMSCGDTVLTVHADHGVTPMFLACRATEGREGRARSMMYDGVVSGAPTFEWYRPEHSTWRRLDDQTRHHLMQGGLLLRPYVAPVEDDGLIEENLNATG